MGCYENLISVQAKRLRDLIKKWLHYLWREQYLTNCQPAFLNKNIGLSFDFLRKLFADAFLTSYIELSFAFLLKYEKLYPIIWTSIVS